MARYATPIEGSLGIEIYNRYIAYCIEIKAIPDPFVFWQVVLVDRDKYPISKGGFAHWLSRLQIPQKPGSLPYIWRDPETHAWCLRDVDVQELDSQS